jgi:hypothetical protein
MYLFSFKKFAGHDRVFYTSFSAGKPGDLLETPDDILLNLGEEVAFPELYTQPYPPSPMKNITSAFFGQRFLEFLHRMVYERYSTYKNVMKYFVSMEIQELLMREPSFPMKKNADLSGAGQTLFVFPDNWTRYTTIPTDWFESKEVINLVSTDTQKRKDIHRRTIKKSLQGKILATHSEVFQPYANLKKILFFDPNKWYYNNQQDPRYSLPLVIKKMGELYGAEVVEIQNEKAVVFRESIHIL